MWTMMVVAIAPILGHAADLVQASEDVTVEDFSSQRPVESFDVGVLRRFTGLDVDELDTVALSPLPQQITDEFRAVVQA